jgi:hypothetical protein
MEKYKLSDFGLIKQSLKRKLKDFLDVEIKENVEKILNKRTTKFDLESIEYIINTFYSDEFSSSRKKSDQPLSVYYKEQNKEKYLKLKTLILIKKNNPTVVLEKEIKDLVQKSKEIFMEISDYEACLNDIADKFGVLPNEAYKISDKIESEWIKKITV